MYCGHACMCVCLSTAAVRPHHCTDPDVTWWRGRGCPLVVHYWADLQSVHALRCYGPWQHNANPSYKLASIPRYDDIVRTLGGVCALLAGDWRVTGAFSKLRSVYGKCMGVAGWPSTGGVLNITAAAWTAGSHWWRSGNIMRTQNVSEYMLVLALCLVVIIRQTSAKR